MSSVQRIPGRRLLLKAEMDNGNLQIESPTGNPVASLWWRPTGRFTLHLEHLEVSENYQGQGLGEFLLRQFLRRFPQLYPKTRYLSGNATSQGVVRLLRKILGPLRNGADISHLPKRSPRYWYKTKRRTLVQFLAPK